MVCRRKHQRLHNRVYAFQHEERTCRHFERQQCARKRLFRLQLVGYKQGAYLYNIPFSIGLAADKQHILAYEVDNQHAQASYCWVDLVHCVIAQRHREFGAILTAENRGL